MKAAEGNLAYLFLKALLAEESVVKGAVGEHKNWTPFCLAKQSIQDICRGEGSRRTGTLWRGEWCRQVDKGGE